MFDPKVQMVMEKVDALREEVTDHWQIPREEALILAQLVRLGRCRSICEIGVSYGFSTLHLAAAAMENGGHVHAIEMAEKKVKAASEYLRNAELSEVVTIHQGDAREVLKEIEPEEPFDFVFIDAQKPQSFEYLEQIWPHLAPRCVIVTDNTLTHKEELRPFVDHLRGLEGFSSCSVPVGNGFELSIRRG